MTKYALQWRPAAELNGDALRLQQALQQDAQTYDGQMRQTRAQHGQTLSNALGRATSDDDRTDAVRQYEVDYQASHKDHAQLLERFKAVARQMSLTLAVGAGQPGIFTLMIEVPPAPDAKPTTQKSDWGTEIVVQPRPTTTDIGRVLVGNRRFFQIDAPTGLAHDKLYVQPGSQVQYVRDGGGHFVRRFVKRAIKDSDITSLNKGLAMRASVGPKSAAYDEKTQKEKDNYPKRGTSTADKVFYHLQQGSGRFVSTTTTKHDIHGNTGKSFTDPGRGFVVIDLARIPQDSIRDVHTEKAIIQGIGTNETEFRNSFGQGNDDKPTRRAIRDVVRTREVLVAGQVPYRAVIYRQMRQNPWINGAAQYSGAEKDALVAQFPDLPRP